VRVFLKYFFLSYSSIFSLRSPFLGALLALVSVLHPNAGICGAIGVCFAALYLFLINSKITNRTLIGSVLRNCLLIGLLVGNLFALNLYVLFFLATIIFLTLITTTALEALFTKSYLPVLSLPFSFVGLTIFMLSPQIYNFTHLPAIYWSLDIIGLMPSFATHFFHSISSVLLFTSPTIGLIFWLTILFTSPLCAVFLWTGFVIGTGFESLFHTVDQSLLLYSDGLNYSLIFAMIAGVFLTPSRFSIILATLATLITSLVVMISAKILNAWYLPILSLPFCLVNTLILLSLKIIRPSVLSQIFFNSPEENFENSELLKNRYRFGEIGIFSPVRGEWKIEQGFDGDITHRGLWRYGLDFVAVNEKGEKFLNKGFEPSDHFSFGKEIISPIDGWVFDCFGGNEDNQIAQVSGEKYGNYIILRSVYGIFIVLFHLKKDSLCVANGEFVKVGQKLAECGNSGYSPEPHLHLHVQYSAKLGAPTVPFHLLNYAVDSEVHFHRTPLKNEIIRDLNLNKISEKIFNFRIGQKFIFENEKKKIFTIENQMDERTGELYFTDGINRIYHAKIGANFYFYKLKSKKGSILFDLMIAAARIPLTYGKELKYSDQLPSILTHKISPNFRKFFQKILGLKIKNSRSIYTLDKGGLNIDGSHKKVTSFFKIDPTLGIKEFGVGSKKYSRL